MRLKTIVPILGLMILVLVACSAQVTTIPTSVAPAATDETAGPEAGSDQATPTPATAAPTGADEPACPQVDSDTRLLASVEGGFCLLYPATYKVEKATPWEMLLVIGGWLNPTDPRVSISVEEANGRTAAEAAAQVAQDFGVQDTGSPVTIDGVEGMMLDKLLGQDMTRQVLVVHEGLLYRLSFSPADEALEAYRGMEQLYGMVLDSFTFVPASVAEAAGSDCLDPKAGEQALTDADLGLCLLSPEGYGTEKTSEDAMTLYVGSLLDVAHPKVFIERSPAGGKDAQTLAEEAAVELEAAMPGLTIDRTFGLTIGFEPAWVLENVPGQDISRQVYAVHGDELYKLTFVPASKDAGEAYTEMEVIYELVTRSFRFLD